MANNLADAQTPKAGWEAGAPRKFQLANHRRPRDKPATFLPKSMKPSLIAVPAWVLAAGLIPVCAQINTGSDGRDGAFNPTQNTVIDMADHPDGIYQYTSVNIPAGVTVTFKPNANNTPVVWLVKAGVTITGSVSLSGNSGDRYSGGDGGPGAYPGGNPGTQPADGQGPGAGGTGADSGGNASYGDIGATNTQGLVGGVYGNRYLIPLLGGSGGGGRNNGGGGGGGGAILIASPNAVQVDGFIEAYGGGGSAAVGPSTAGAGSGGGIRIIAQRIVGHGWVNCNGGTSFDAAGRQTIAGIGRVRFDTYDNRFGGVIAGIFSMGFQPIAFPASGQSAQLAITSVAGNQVVASPTGQLATPDVIIPAQQANPIPIVVSCANVPLNTSITVTVKPVNGTAVSAVGQNSAGTLAASTATVSLNLPRGGGLIYATATIPLGGQGASLEGGKKAASYAQTGLTTDGERFTKMDITAALGSAPQIAYVTESGKRFALPAQARQ